FSSLYGHTSKIVVSQGDYIRRGDILAYMGTTGRSTGSHLHFEIWQYGRPINPLRLVRLESLTQVHESLAKRPNGNGVVLFPGGAGGVDE
ncbi:MAG: M23 family metallopeptidase, partial [Elusimicrobiota bacterium]